MSLATPIPALRFTTSASLTIPGSETWLITSIRQRTQGKVTLTLNGNAFILCDTTIPELSAGPTYTYNQGRDFVSGSKFLMQTGDTLVSSIDTLLISYYILETDFSLDGSAVPDLRRSLITASPSLPPISATVTVPASETWIVKLINYNFEMIDDSITSPTLTANMKVNISSTAQIWETVSMATSGNNTDSVNYVGANVLKEGLILKTGDSLTVDGNGVGTAKSTLHLYTGYWILEQDF